MAIPMAHHRKKRGARQDGPIDHSRLPWDTGGLQRPMFKNFWLFRAVVAGVNLGVIGLFAGAGWLVDARYGTSPKGVVSAALISLPFALAATLKAVKAMTAKKVFRPEE
jgi:hypothetical protein